MNKVKIAQEFIKPTKIINEVTDSTVNRVVGSSRYNSLSDIANEVVDDVALSTIKKAKKQGFMTRIRNFFGISKSPQKQYETLKKQRAKKLAEWNSATSKTEQMRKEFLEIETSYKECVDKVKRLTTQKNRAHEECERLRSNLRELESKRKKLKARLKEDTQEFYGSGHSSFRDGNLVISSGPSSYAQNNALSGIIWKENAIKELEPKISELKGQIIEAEKCWEKINSNLESAIQKHHELKSKFNAAERAYKKQEFEVELLGNQINRIDSQRSILYDQLLTEGKIGYGGL